MHLLTTLLLSALPAALAQNAQAIVAGLQAIQGQSQYLDYMVASFNGDPVTGTLDVVNIQQQADTVGRAIEAAQWAAESTPYVLDSQGSEAVSAAVLALRPVTKALLERISYKKAAFDAVFVGLFSVSKQVQKTLEDQKALTLALGHAVAEKLSGAYRTAAPQLIDEFRDEFDEAIGKYVVADAVQLPALPIPGLIPKRDAELETVDA